MAARVARFSQEFEFPSCWRSSGDRFGVSSCSSHCENWDLDLSDEGFCDSLLGRVCHRERAVLTQTSSQDFFGEKGRSEADFLEESGAQVQFPENAVIKLFNP